MNPGNEIDVDLDSYPIFIKLLLYEDLFDVIKSKIKLCLRLHSIAIDNK